MPDAVSWICFGFAALCLLYAFWTGFRDRRGAARSAATPARLAAEPGVEPQSSGSSSDEPPADADVETAPAAPAGPLGASALQELGVARGTPGERIAALAVAFLFALLGAAAAAVDSK